MTTLLEEKVVVFGGTGLVGSAIKLRFQAKEFGYERRVLAPLSSEVNLLEYDSVRNYIEAISPSLIVMAAGHVGGISFNTKNQAELFSSNLLMNFNLLKAAFDLRITKLVLISSSCLYPANLNSPFSEDSLFMGLPEPTNDGYAAAKLTAIRQLLVYRNNYGLNWQTCIPTNVYGLENLDIERAHVIPQMIQKIIAAKKSGSSQVEFFGDGTPIREFIFNTDLGDAIHWIHSRRVSEPIINVSPGNPINMRELAILVADVCGYQGDLVFNSNFPNGHPDKSLYNNVLSESGWKPGVSLRSGIELLVKDSLK